MTRKELMQFLNKEAQAAVGDILPQLLPEITEAREVERKLCIDQYLFKYKDPNLKTMIVNELVRRIEELGFAAHSHSGGGIFLTLS